MAIMYKSCITFRTLNYGNYGLYSLYWVLRPVRCESHPLRWYRLVVGAHETSAQTLAGPESLPPILSTVVPFSLGKPVLYSLISVSGLSKRVLFAYSGDRPENREKRMLSGFVGILSGFVGFLSGFVGFLSGTAALSFLSDMVSPPLTGQKYWC